jgi:hypothetical protein
MNLPRKNLVSFIALENWVTRFYRTSICLLLFCAMIFANPSNALAIPSLPSSFYGTVKVNSASVPDGTLVQAIIAGKVVAFCQTQTYQGGSVYSLDIPGDDPGTPAVEGGREGDVIQFKLGGILATQTGTWHSATNINLNLSATSTSTAIPLVPTLTHVPTQTPIRNFPTQLPSKTPTPTIRVTLPATQSQVYPTTTATNLPETSTSTPVQPGPVVAVTGEDAGNRVLGVGLPLAIALIMIIGAGVFVWFRRRK